MKKEKKIVLLFICLGFIGCSTNKTNNKRDKVIYIDGKSYNGKSDTNSSSVEKFIDDTSYYHNKKLKQEEGIVPK